MTKSLLCLLALFAVAGCATAAEPTDETDSGAPADTSIGDGTADTPTDAPSDGPCLAPKKVCGGKCVTLDDDRANCGG